MFRGNKLTKDISLMHSKKYAELKAYNKRIFIKNKKSITQ